MFAASLVVLCAPVIASSFVGDSTGVDSTRVVEMPPMVISASRWQERSSTVSRQILRMDVRDVQQRNPGTMADLVESSGEVFMQRSQMGGGSPRLRGFAANSVLLVVDGVRLNNAIYRSGNLQNLIQLDANALSSTEVLFGPGSVQYGSDAMGGVLVFTTKDPLLSPSGFFAHTSSLARYASATTERTLSAEASFSWENVATYTSVTASMFGDVRSGRTMPSAAPTFGLRTFEVKRIDGRDSIVPTSDPHLQSPSGYSQVNVLQKVLWKIDDVWSLTYGGHLSTSTDIPRYDRLVELRNGRPRSAEWYYGPQFWTLQSLTAKATSLGSVVNDVVATASFQWYEESRHNRNLGNDWLRHQEERVAITNLNIDGRTRLQPGSSIDRDLYYGIEVSYQDISSVASQENIVSGLRTPAATRYPDGGSTYTTYAAYSQLRWGFGSDVTVAVGLRGTAVSLQSAITDSSVFSLPFSTITMTNGAVTGSLGATWIVSELITVHGNVANGFRAPNVDDVAKVFESAGGQLVVPNPGLGPVTVTTAELGVEVRPIVGLALTSSVYRSWLTNAIEVRPFTFNGRDSIVFDGVPSAVVAPQNFGTGRIAGLSCGVDYRAYPWRVMVTATYVTGRDETNDFPLEKVTPSFGRFHMGWYPFDIVNVSLDVRWSAAWTMDMISPIDEAVMGIQYPNGGLPSWTVADLRTSVDISTSWTIQAAVENIFDLHYRSAQSGISAPGRNVVLAVRFRS